MAKKIILRGAIGVPLGIAIGYLITIFMSFAFADGYYSPCEPKLVEAVGNEINAVAMQAALCGILGASFAGASVVWEIERWSLVKQTGIYFGVVSVTMAFVSYFSYWMEHSLSGFLSYFAIFIIIFIIIWAVQFIVGKRVVKKMNEDLYKANRK